MKREDDSLLNPPLEKLLAEIPQKYELVLTATRRAKQIIRERLLNPVAFGEQERHRKPLSISLVDIAEGKIDKQALMAPDIQFDDIEGESLALFTDVESFDESPSSADEEVEDKDMDLEEDEDEDDEDDLVEVDDLFDLGSDEDDDEVSD